MGVRPPQNDESEPDVIAFGIAAVDAQLAETELTFPATVDDIEAQLGDAEIPYEPGGRSILLKEALQQVEQTTFEDRQELLNTLHAVFEQQRTQSVGLMDRLRSLLPF